MENTQRRYVTIPVTVPNPTLAGATIEASVQLDRAFNKIVGAAYHQIADGGVANNYQVGFRTSRKQWVDPVNINNWNANTGVGVDQKFRTFGTKGVGYGAGDVAYVQVIPGANTTAAMSGELVLILEADLDEIPRQ